jgi:hypothetical protein
MAGFAPPQPGPFSDQLVPKQEEVKFGQGASPAANIAGIATSVFQGLARGRVARFARDEEKKSRALQVLGQTFSTVMSNPNITDEKKAQLQDKFSQTILPPMMHQLDASQKGVSSDHKQGMGGKIAAFGKQMLTGMAGGKLEGQPLDAHAVTDLMGEMHDALTNPEHQTANYVSKAQEQMQAAAKDLKDKLGRDPYAHEIQGDPGFQKAAANMERYGGKGAKEAISTFMGGFQAAPKPGTEDAIRADALSGRPPAIPIKTDAPPGAPARKDAGTQPLFMAPGPADGLVTPGNIDLTTLPPVKLDGGKWGTVNSASREVNGKEILYPTIVNGKQLSDDEAFAYAQKTGKNLGVFKDGAAADSYARRLHEDWEQGKIPGVQMNPDDKLPPGVAVAAKAPAAGTPPPSRIESTQWLKLETMRATSGKEEDIYLDGKKTQGVQVGQNVAGVAPGWYDKEGNPLTGVVTKTKEPKTTTELLAQDLLDSGEAKTPEQAKKKAADISVKRAVKTETPPMSAAMRERIDIEKGLDPKISDADAEKKAAQFLKRKGDVDLEKKREGLDSAGGGSGAPSNLKFAPGGKSLANPNGDTGIETAAWDWLFRGVVPFTGMGSGKRTVNMREQAVKRAGELLQEVGLTNQDVPALRAKSKADSGALSRITSMGAAVDQFEETVNRNMTTARALSEKWDRTDVPAANRLAAAWNKGTGDSDALNFAAQMHGLASEWAKVMSGSTSSAGVAVGNAKDAEAIMGPYLSNGQVQSLFDNVIIPDMNNRTAAISGEKQKLIRDIRSIVPDLSGRNSTQTPPAANMLPGGITLDEVNAEIERRKKVKN